MKKICATCEWNESIVKNVLPGCNSLCTKYKNRKYTSYMKKMNTTNPVTGKPNSECDVIDPRYHYGWGIPIDDDPVPTEFHLCSEKNKGSCPHYKETGKLYYTKKEPCCPMCGKLMTKNFKSWYHTEKAMYNCANHNYAIILEYDWETVSRVIDAGVNIWDCYDVDYDETEKQERELKIKVGLLLPEEPPIKTVYSTLEKEKKPW
jgi:hypothetical protein